MNETSATFRRTARRVWLLVAAGLFAGSAAVAGAGAVCSVNRPCVPGEVCVLPDGSCDIPETEGLCEIAPQTCPGVFDPVCGCDAMTYDNRCEALQAGVNVDHPGECAVPCGGITGIPCGPGEFCALPPAMCGTPNLDGVCAPVPDSCPGTFDPVCGCDGVTYDNPCLADAAEAQIDHDGPCVVACGGSTGVTCDTGEFCLIPDGACDEPDTQGFCAPTPEDCPAVFEPVCGCDGVTYDNRCLADVAGVAVDQEGACPQGCGGPDGKACDAGDFCKLPEGLCDVPDPFGTCQPIPGSCPITFDPVCGCDGVTYANACEADAVTAQIDFAGECTESCQSAADCSEGEFCQSPDEACGTAGVCQPQPSACPAVFEPVCGCDGATYLNRCEASSAGVSVNLEGPCGPACGGVTGNTCAAGEFCAFPDGTCDDPDLAGVCLQVPSSCPVVFEPVCGCDGETYGNRCEARVAEARVAYDGACSPVCGGIAGIPCGPDEFCSFPAGTCDVADVSGVCEPLPGQCSEMCFLVCGCDGVTYANECLASIAGVALDRPGGCDPTGRLIRGVRFDTTSDMRWQAASAALSYNVYLEIRVTPTFTYAGECFAPSLPMPEASVATHPEEGEVWLFQVTGAFPEGEGPMGIVTDCSSRAPVQPCGAR